MTDIYPILATVLELDADDIDPARPLDEYETWDSVAALSVVVSLRSDFGVMINSADLKQARTPADLNKIVLSKQLASASV